MPENFEIKSMKQVFNKIVDYVSKYKIVLLIILIGIALFYWYSLRPSIIKKDCYNEAREKAIEKRGVADGKFIKDDYDTYYKWCLQKKGL